MRTRQCLYYLPNMVSTRLRMMALRRILAWRCWCPTKSFAFIECSCVACFAMTRMYVQLYISVSVQRYIPVYYITPNIGANIAGEFGTCTSKAMSLQLLFQLPSCMHLIAVLVTRAAKPFKMV
eukprot:jgi/Botrbrau1/21739/Bobra.43_1s0133.1